MQDYKQQAVELVFSSGRSVTSVAKEVGLSASVLRRWVDKLAAGRRFAIAGVCVVADRGLISAETLAELEARRQDHCSWCCTQKYERNTPPPGYVSLEAGLSG